MIMSLLQPKEEKMQLGFVQLCFIYGFNETWSNFMIVPAMRCLDFAFVMSDLVPNQDSYGAQSCFLFSFFSHFRINKQTWQKNPSLSRLISGNRVGETSHWELRVCHQQNFFHIFFCFTSQNSLLVRFSSCLWSKVCSSIQSWTRCFI